MRTDIEDNRANYYDWDGQCDPAKTGSRDRFATFSVGIFKWIPTTDGEGLKHGKVICRVIGFVNDPHAVYYRATYICRDLDRGHTLLFKTFRIYRG